jgi:flagellar basal body P-ring protein FlgI
MAVLALGQVGVAAGKKKKEPPPPKINETVGDLAFVVSNGELKVEGVGLVTGLDNSGADPPPSWYRQQLVDEMSKAGVEKAEKLLANPQVSMVLVRMTIPMGVNPTDRLDVQVEVPPACGTRSLAGGYLLTTRLYQVAVAKGTALRDHELALAQGPVMIGTAAKPADPKIGRVLGGGRVKKDYPYTLVIKENRESYRTAKMLENVVNERFHQTEDGHQKGVATGKTNSYLVLRVPALYHQNQERYFRVVQLLPMVDGPELRVRRLALWSRELLDPKTAGVAALKLEGLGNGASEALQEGLKSDNVQVRFFSAEALAYLNDISGVEVLGQTVVRQPEFRAYALAALAALDQAASHMKLRKLMDEADLEVRYGAFNALRTLNSEDPFLGQVRVLEDPRREEDDEPADSMAMAIAAAARRRNRPEDPFALYIVDSEGPPLVHVSRTRRAEIVIFGRQQRLLPPVVLGTGAILLNADVNDEKIEMSKIVASPYGNADSKVTTSLELAEVVRQAANLGASYPEIVTILEDANRRRNLAGQLVIDAVPSSNSVYLEAILGRDTSSRRDDGVRRASTEAPRPRWRRLFGLFNRASDPNPTPAPAPDSTSQRGSPDVAGAHSGTPPDAKTRSIAVDPAKKSDEPPADSDAKKDDAVQKTMGEATPPRRRFFDFLRRDDGP